MLHDRRVHATFPNRDEIVRYDKAGKWYRERATFGREQITLAEAVRLATLPGVTVHLGMPGGTQFDARVAKERSDAA